MFHSKTLNKKIDHLKERILRVVYEDYDCSYQDLLKMIQYFRVHLKNIQSLATELLKGKQNISTHTMKHIPQMRDNLIYE